MADTGDMATTTAEKEEEMTPEIKDKTAKKTKKKVAKKAAAKKTKKKAASRSSKKYEPFGVDRPMSASSAARILEDIELWKHEKENPKPDTKATAFGSALHCKLLEPEKFDEQFIIAHDAPVNPKTGEAYGRTSKMYQSWLAEMQLAAGKKKIILPEEAVELELMEKEYKPVIDNLVAAGKKNGLQLKCERKVEWVDRETGQPCIGYMDAEIGGVVIDLKTTAEMGENKLHRKCQDSYFMQGAVYAEALKVIDKVERPLVLFVFLRSKPPYSIYTVTMTEKAMELGLKAFRKAIRKYRECAEKKSFKNSRKPVQWEYKKWKEMEIEGV